MPTHYQRRLKEPFIFIAWMAVAALAIFLRTHHLEERPVHADEATGARILAKQLEGESYQFNPTHFHGPILSLMATPLAQVRGEHKWSQLKIQTLRTSTALAGILLIFTPLFWVQALGKWGALGAAACLGTSPLLVYYSRMYIHESWLVLFGMLACAGVYHLIQKPSLARATMTGLAIGLMFATKETFAISILAWVPATGLILLLKMRAHYAGESVHTWPAYIKAAAILTVVTLVSAGLFYTNFLRQPAQFLDAFRTFTDYQTTSGHDKAFSYYLELMLWPKHNANVWWTEGLILIVALASLFLSRKHPVTFRACVFIGVACVLHLLIYSSISYKTPWLMLLPWALACLLAGYGLQAFSEQQHWVKWLSISILIFGLAHQTKQSLIASGRLANSPYNPYAYVPTSTDCEKMALWLQQLEVKQSLGTLAVVGSEYWPLPWYLRNIGTEIGYWPTTDPALNTLSVVLAMPGQAIPVSHQLKYTHTELPRSLRTNVPVVLHLRNDIWKQWLAHSDE